MHGTAKEYVEKARSVLTELTTMPHAERQKKLAEWETPLPRYFYHYRGCSGANDERNLHDLLVNSHFFLRAAADFNDPFECRFQFGRVAEESEVIDYLASAAMHYASDVTVADRLAAGIARIGIDGIDGIERIAIDETNARLQSIGIFCFSESDRDILMWAHYGESHRGVCIEFDVAEGIETFGLCKRVSYDGPMPTLDYPETAPNAILQPIFRKARHWFYEQEWRVAIPSGCHQHLDFSSSAISSVIYGCASTSATHKVVDKILAEREAKSCPPIRERKLKKADREYTLVDG